MVKDIKKEKTDVGEDVNGKTEESAASLDQSKENVVTETGPIKQESHVSKVPIEILSVELVKSSGDSVHSDVEKSADEPCLPRGIQGDQITSSCSSDGISTVVVEKNVGNVYTIPDGGSKLSANNIHSTADGEGMQESPKGLKDDTEPSETRVVDQADVPLTKDVTNPKNDKYVDTDSSTPENHATASALEGTPSEGATHISEGFENGKICVNANNTIIESESMEIDTTTNSANGLSLLAQYGSDNEEIESDNDSVIEVPPSATQDYRSNVVEIDSDSDSDSSSSESDVEYLKELRKTIEKRIEIDDDDDDEGDNSAQVGTRKKPTAKVKAKGELLLEDLPPIQDLQITVPENECVELGKIHSIVDQLVLVSALPNSVLLDLETVLFLDKGQRVLGEVFDVLGQVADPLYCIRFNSNEQINEKNIHVNDIVYLAPKTPYTQYIVLSSLMKMKGSDASWENDLEPPPRFLDYSDDEQEQLARRQLRNKDRPVDHDDPQKRVKTDTEAPQVYSYGRPQSAPPRHRYPPSTRGFNGPPNRGSYNRPPRQQFNPQYGNQQTPANHHSSSWHSNYYPQHYAAMPPQNIAYPGGYPSMPAQAYSQIPVYPMAMPYNLPQQHIRQNNHPPEHNQYSPNVFSNPGHFDHSLSPPNSQ